jgi:membrane protein implicated in regulation of membrane protease activity
MVDTVRMILVLALVLLGSFLIAGIFGAPIITALVYLYWQSRRRVKYLEKQNAESAKSVPESASPVPPSTPDPLSPASTDA